MNFDNSNGLAASRAVDPTNDVRLATARKRLAESRDKADAIEGLREIVANLLGSEEIGLFSIDQTTGAFQVCWSFGADLENYDLTRALGQAGLQRVMRGECQIDVSRKREQAITEARAFIPIRVEKQTIAIIAILRLLPQKLDFDAADMELFKLLSDEAAKPIFCLSGHSKPNSNGTGIKA